VEFVAFLIALLTAAVLIVVAASWVQRKASLGWGRTVALDARVLVSYRYGLTGRRDRLLRLGSTVIPVEWK
jgi:hypothetical protein